MLFLYRTVSNCCQIFVDSDVSELPDFFWCMVVVSISQEIMFTLSIGWHVLMWFVSFRKCCEIFQLMLVMSQRNVSNDE